MFAAFLSPDMTYSCPIWLPKSDPEARSDNLEAAQHRKLDAFIKAAKLKAADHVLEIGTGWGSFAIKAAREVGCKVTSLTLSEEQKVLAEERIAEAGLTEKIEVLLCDYRALERMRKGVTFDKVVSIEMLEAVGREFLSTYFGCIDRLLKKDGGIAVFQCITMPETVSAAQSASYDAADRLSKMLTLACDSATTHMRKATTSSEDTSSPVVTCRQCRNLLRRSLAAPAIR